MGIASYEERTADRLTALERRFEELIVQDRSGSKKFGASRIPFGGATGVLTDYASFVWDNVNKRLGIGTGTPSARLTLAGTDTSYASGPHIETYTNDSFPLAQLMSFTHDNVNLSFDAYYDGSWRSSDVGSNFQLRKVSDVFQIMYNSGTNAGSVLTWAEALGIGVDGFVRLAGLNVRISANSYSILNNGVTALGMSNFGFVLFQSGNAGPAIYAINGSLHTTNEVFDAGGTHTPTAGTATSVNIYWSAGNTRYEIENKRGSTLALRAWLFDAS